MRELFERLEEVAPAEREAWLARECAREPEVYAELRRLTDAEAESDGWLSGRGTTGWLRVEAPAPLEPGTRVGPYVVRSHLGSGGMGTVYCAEQERPRRLIALKTLRADQLGEDLLRRFRVEAEVLGHLRHPGIAQIHEAGTHAVGSAQVPYLAMEYVEDARDLIAFADERGLDQRGRLELFAQVCDAVHHAHRRGVLHRDIKPGNVLVDAEGRAKVIDFGLARPLDSGLHGVSAAHTRAGELLGTLAYMSPEHVSGRSWEVDVRSDVYSLGCLLCELVTGAPPRELSDLPLPAAVVEIAERDVELGTRASGDLRWVLLKTLERDPARRYDSAAALADDVRRLLGHEPVLAGPPSAIHRLERLVRRHRALLAGAAAVLAALAIGLVQARQEARTARRAEARAEREAKVAVMVSYFLSDLFSQAHLYRGGSSARVVDALELAELELAGVDDPLIRATMSGLVGIGHLGLDDRERAEPLLREAVEVLRAGAPADDLFRLRIEVGWADLLEQRGRLAESTALSEELLPRLEARLGPTQETTCYLRNNLARCYDHADRWAEAEALYAANLEAVLAPGGIGARTQAHMDCLHKLGQARAGLGRLDEAFEAYAESLELARELPGVSPLYEATILMDLAAAESYLDPERALPRFERVEELYARLSPSASNRYAIASGKAWTLLEAGRVDAAREGMLRARDVLEAIWSEPGARHVDMLRLDAAIARAEGELGLAEAAAREALELAREVLPDSSTIRMGCRDLLADVLLDLGDGKAALVEARAAHSAASAALGATHHTTLGFLDTLVRALAEAGESERAVERARELVAGTRADDVRLARRRALLAELADG